MGFEGWLTLAVVCVALLAMLMEWVSSVLALSASLGLLLLCRAISTDDALSGFSNPALATIALLLIIADALENSRWIRYLAGIFFGKRTGRLSLLRGLFPIAGMSAFLANTPVVAAMIPAVRAWAREHKQAVSSYLMPISFASLLGGICTLIGTTPNLVVDGLLRENGDPGLGMFELARAGLPLAVACIVVIVFLTFALLPKRKDTFAQFDANPRQFIARLRVPEGSRMAGAAVSEFRNLENIFLSGIERGSDVFFSVRPSTRIHAGDVLSFVGRVGSIAEFTSQQDLEIVTSGEGLKRLLKTGRGNLVEAVISPGSPLVGASIREAGFRGRYDAVVIAVHRHGEKLVGKIGDIVIRPGDTFLLAVGRDFLPRWRDSHHFYLVSPVQSVPKAIHGKDWIEPAVLAGVVALAACRVLPLLQATIAGVMCLMLLRRIQPARVLRNMNWGTLILIGASISLGEALESTGAAEALSSQLAHLAEPFGSVGVIAAVFVSAAVLTELVHNVAAAALIFPIALNLAETGGVSMHAIAAACALGASSCFLTPVGYHTNAMVAGAAGYTLRDFVRAGLPLKAVYVVFGIFLVWAAW